LPIWFGLYVDAIQIQRESVQRGTGPGDRPGPARSLT
jgi:hypothetical protein